MGETMNKLFKSVLSIFLILSSITLIPVNATTVQAVETEYEIYPTPHKVTYAQGSFIMRKEVNVVVESKIDQETRNHIRAVLALKDKTVSVSDQKVEGKTNLFVGINGSGEYVDTYAQQNYSYSQELFRHYGGYFFATTKDEVVVVGRDSDAAFYGITTLKQIFNQIEGSTIRHLEMEDYADVNIRGFIEGYYGIPWTNEDRMELMKFGGDIKMTSYIFAPKDDPYHKQKWREEYPAEELEKLKEMVKVGNDTKCRFVWTAHPFMGGFDRNNADAEIETLIKKFEHLYTDAGVRQFGILGDDVGNLPRSIVVDMMKRVGQWAKEKGDVYDIVFCPGGYNDAWQGDYSELNDYDEGFPENVHIFWTGQAVCQPIEQVTLNNFRNKHSEHHGQRRAPLFWLNWPVNDINHSRMIMGEGSKMLKTDINVEDLAGAVTNPMQESEPSKVAIFQLADYSWNVKGFDAKKTWADSFKYIDVDASEELHTLAKHMSNPEPNGHGLVMPESVEIAPKLKAFKEAVQNDTVTAEQIDELVQEFQIIIDACDGFTTKSKNEEMKTDLAPFIASLKDLSEANIHFLESYRTLKANDKLGAFNLYTAGQTELKESATHKKPTLGKDPVLVNPGSTQLIPFAKYLEKALSKPMSDYIAGGEGQVLQITASSSFNSFYEGNINNIIDGNDKTHAWHDGGEAKGQYYQVNFSIPQTIFGVHILNGVSKQGKEQDTFGTGEVKYLVQGSDQWKSLGEFTNYPERVDISQIEKENVVAVRYECKAVGSGNRWPSMREFKVSFHPESANDFTKTPIFTSNGWSSNEAVKMVDDNPNSLVHFNVRQDVKFAPNQNRYLKGDYYGVKLSKPITLGKIDILQGKDANDPDMFHSSKLQYSLDGTNWVDIPGATFNKKEHIVFDASNLDIKAQYVRLVAEDTQPYWVRVREFDVDAKVFYNAKAYTNVEGLELKGNVFTDHAELQPKSDLILKPGQYVGIKLDRIHEITNVTQDISTDQLTLEVGMNEYEFKPYTSGSINARYVRLINHTDQDVQFNLNSLTTKSHEVYPKTFLKDASNVTIQDNKLPESLFDNDWNTQVAFGGDQNAGRKFVYDLGQEIDINKLKVVCRDSEHDYPRHGKISVSLDKEHWTDIMELGKQDGPNDGEASNTDEIGAVLPNHEISYNTKEVSLENAQKARYIKFEITRSKEGANKWIRFQEFIINDGAYVPTVNDPTFESNCIDTLGGEYSNMIDGKLDTFYVPAKDKGTFTYHVSDNNTKNVVKFVQAASAISNAKVTAKIMEESSTSSTVKTVELGTLSQTVNEFVFPVGTKVLAVTVTWDGLTPYFGELILSQNETVELGNKEALNKLLSTKQDTATWTKDTKEAYDTAFASAQKVAASDLVSQESVDSVIKAIETAIANHQIKGDITILQQIVDNRVVDSKKYTVASWRTYEAMIANLEKAIKNADNTTVQDVEALTAQYDEAFAGLVYSPLKAEEATLVSQDGKAFVDSVAEGKVVYTTASWKLFTNALQELNKLLDNNQTKPVDPSLLDSGILAVVTAKNDLVLATSLAALIVEFDTYDPQNYTDESYKVYKDAIATGKEALNKGTVETVAAAVTNITKAKEGLKLLVSVDTIQDLINEMKALNSADYTEVSYQVLMDVVAKVEALELDKLSYEELRKVSNELLTAKQQMVNVVALNAQVKAAGALDAQLYTKKSYAVLEEALAGVKPLLVKGTQSEVDAQTKVIDLAIRGLQLRVTQKDVDQYMKDIVLKENKGIYTKESYDVYLNAYHHLVTLSKDLENTTKADFIQAVEAFENAEKSLVKVGAIGTPEIGDKTDETDTPETGDMTKVVYYVGVALLSCIAFIYVLNKKRKTNL